MLGRTGLRVSRLCFGSLTVSPLQAALPTEAGAEVLAYALSRGVNMIDTAQYYRNYDILRRGLAKAGYPGDTVICTKTYAWNRQLAEEAVEEARRALDRDVIDIFLLHEQESIHTLRGHREAIDYLYECKARGTIRAVGASTHRIAAVKGSVRIAHDAGFGLDVVFALCNQSGIGIGDGSTEEMLRAVAEAQAAGLGTMAMKVLGGGTLYRDAASALAFMLRRPEFDTLAIGMQSFEEVDANVAFFEKGAFPDTAAAVLGNRMRRLLIEEDECRGCGECVDRCGQHALRLADGHAVCDPSRCVLCGYCAAACPAFAIRVL